MSSRIVFESQSRKCLRPHEVNAILLLLDYFDTDIICISPGAGKTPDLIISNLEWELKSPQGSGAKTIENILKKATKQSRNIVLDFSRIKMNGSQALARTRYYLRSNRHGIKRLIVITKSRRVIDLTDEL